MAAGYSRWPWWRRWFGRRAERAAAKHLRGKGYRILAANLDQPVGELDLLALQGDTLVAVEVRSTASGGTARPLESVNAAKQKKITDSVTRFLQHRGLLGRVTVRFDIIAICWPPDAQTPEIQHVEDAFPAVGRFQMFN